MSCCLIITIFFILIILYILLNQNNKFFKLEHFFDARFVTYNLDTCCQNDYFIVNRVGGKNYFLKQTNNVLSFEEYINEDKLYENNTDEETYRFRIIRLETNYQIVNLTNNFSNIIIMKSGNVGDNQKLKYRIQSITNGNFLMNKKDSDYDGNQVYLNPSEICNGNGIGNNRRNYKLSVEGNPVNTEEISGRDTSILLSNSSMCPETYPYPINEFDPNDDNFTDTDDFNIQYDKIKQRSKCSTQPPIIETQYFNNTSGNIIDCFKPPCKTFNIPRGECYTIENKTTTGNGNEKYKVHIKNPINLLTQNDLKRLEFMIICYNCSGNIKTGREEDRTQLCTNCTNINLNNKLAKARLT